MTKQEQTNLSVAKDSNWSFPQDIKGFDSTDPPALTAYNEILYLAFKGKNPTDQHSDHKIYIATFEGRWSETVVASYRTENFQTGNSPALIVFQNRLFLLWKNYQEENIILAYSELLDLEADAYTFFPYKEKLSFGTSEPPALAVFKDKNNIDWLYMTWKGFGDSDIRCSYTDGSTDANNKIKWSEAKKTGLSSDKGPALAVFNNVLYMARKAHSSENILLSSLAISGEPSGNWNDLVTQPNYKTSEGPALAVYDEKLYLAFKCPGVYNETDPSTQDYIDVYYSNTEDPANWSDSYGVFNQVFSYTHVSIAAMTGGLKGVLNGALYMAYKGANADGALKICIQK